MIFAFGASIIDNPLFARRGQNQYSNVIVPVLSSQSHGIPNVSQVLRVFTSLSGRFLKHLIPTSSFLSITPTNLNAILLHSKHGRAPIHPQICPIDKTSCLATQKDNRPAQLPRRTYINKVSVDQIHQMFQYKPIDINSKRNFRTYPSYPSDSCYSKPSSRLPTLPLHSRSCPYTPG